MKQSFRPYHLPEPCRQSNLQQRLLQSCQRCCSKYPRSLNLDRQHPTRCRRR